MATWEVLMTDRSTRTVDVPSHLPDYVADRWARNDASVFHDLPVVPFSSRPLGCTGLSFSSHSGAFCPVHEGA